MPMRIETYCCSYQGGREYNEDTVRFHLDGNLCAVTVADGLGGHGGGQIASSVAADFIHEAFLENPGMDPDVIRTYYRQANQAVLDKQTDREKMKSTGVSLFVRGGAFMWSHVGDSRLYFFHDGLLVTQTLDHSVSQMAVFSGEITPSQIRFHPDRNKVLRAFGTADNFQAEVSQKMAFPKGASAFLLCSDGFWEYVWEIEMEIELSKAEKPSAWINGMLQRVAGRVPTTHDNCSAAAVFVTKM